MYYDVDRGIVLLYKKLYWMNFIKEINEEKFTSYIVEQYWLQ